MGRRMDVTSTRLRIDSAALATPRRAADIDVPPSAAGSMVVGDLLLPLRPATAAPLPGHRHRHRARTAASDWQGPGIVDRLRQRILGDAGVARAATGPAPTAPSAGPPASLQPRPRAAFACTGRVRRLIVLPGAGGTPDPPTPVRRPRAQLGAGGGRRRRPAPETRRPASAGCGAAGPGGRHAGRRWWPNPRRRPALAGRHRPAGGPVRARPLRHLPPPLPPAAALRVGAARSLAAGGACSVRLTSSSTASATWSAGPPAAGARPRLQRLVDHPLLGHPRDRRGAVELVLAVVVAVAVPAGSGARRAAGPAAPLAGRPGRRAPADRAVTARRSTATTPWTSPRRCAGRGHRADRRRRPRGRAHPSGPGFFASPGGTTELVREHRGRLGLPPVSCTTARSSWIELETGADLHVRLLLADVDLPTDHGERLVTGYRVVKGHKPAADLHPALVASLAPGRLVAAGPRGGGRPDPGAPGPAAGRRRHLRGRPDRPAVAVTPPLRGHLHLVAQYLPAGRGPGRRRPGGPGRHRPDDAGPGRPRGASAGPGSWPWRLLSATAGAAPGARRRPGRRLLTVRAVLAAAGRSATGSGPPPTRAPLRSAVVDPGGRGLVAVVGASWPSRWPAASATSRSRLGPRSWSPRPSAWSASRRSARPTDRPTSPRSEPAGRGHRPGRRRPLPAHPAGGRPPPVIGRAAAAAPGGRAAGPRHRAPARHRHPRLLRPARRQAVVLPPRLPGRLRRLRRGLPGLARPHRPVHGAGATSGTPSGATSTATAGGSA